MQLGSSNRPRRQGSSGNRTIPFDDENQDCDDADGKVMDGDDDKDGQNDKEDDVSSVSTSEDRTQQKQRFKAPVSENDRKAAVKALSKQQRDKRRAAKNLNISRAVHCENSVRIEDARRDAAYQRVFETRRQAYHLVNYFLNMWFASSSSPLDRDGRPTSTQAQVADTDLKAVHESLAVIFDPAVTVTMPELSTHYCRPTRVEFGRSVFSGLPSLLTYSEGYEAFCCAVARTAKQGGHNTESLVDKLLVDVVINPSSVIVDGGSLSATAAFRVTTVNAILCGGQCEVEYDGMLFAKLVDAAPSDSSSAADKMDAPGDSGGGTEEGSAKVADGDGEHRQLSDADGGDAGGGSQDGQDGEGEKEDGEEDGEDGERRDAQSSADRRHAMGETGPERTSPPLPQLRIASVDMFVNSAEIADKMTSTFGSLPLFTLPRAIRECERQLGGHNTHMVGTETMPISTAECAQSDVVSGGRSECVVTHVSATTSSLLFTFDQTNHTLGAAQASTVFPAVSKHLTPSDVDKIALRGRHGLPTALSISVDGAGTSHSPTRQRQRRLDVQIYPLHTSTTDGSSDEATSVEATTHLLWVLSASQCGAHCDASDSVFPFLLIQRCLSSVLNSYQQGQEQEQAHRNAACHCVRGLSAEGGDGAADTLCAYRESLDTILSTAHSLLSRSRESPPPGTTAASAAQWQSSLVADFIRWALTLQSSVHLRCEGNSSSQAPKIHSTEHATRSSGTAGAHQSEPRPRPETVVLGDSEHNTESLLRVFGDCFSDLYNVLGADQGSTVDRGGGQQAEADSAASSACGSSDQDGDAEDGADGQSGGGGGGGIRSVGGPRRSDHVSEVQLDQLMGRVAVPRGSRIPSGLCHPSSGAPGAGHADGEGTSPPLTASAMQTDRRHRGNKDFVSGSTDGHGPTPFYSGYDLFTAIAAVRESETQVGAIYRAVNTFFRSVGRSGVTVVKNAGH